MFLQRKHYHDNTVLGQILTVTQDNIPHIAYTQTVYQNTACCHMVDYLAAVLIQGHYIA